MSDYNKDEVKELHYTAQNVVDLIYDTLECLHQVLTNNNIRYTMFGGTTLGAERHGGLIPWDDDADTVILSSDEKRLVALSDTFSTRGFTLDQEPDFGYRLYHSTLAVPRNFDRYPFPFIDIFILYDNGARYDYSTDEARKLWPQSPLPYGCFDRLVDVPFGHLTLRGLSKEDAKQHLDDNYGKDWPSVAWREYDHFFYSGVTDKHISLHGEKARRPARHSQHQQLGRTLQPVVNQTTRRS